MKGIILNAKDNVAAVADNVKIGETISIDEDNCLSAIQDIPGKHKVAITDIEKGGLVIRYGESIGTAKEKIAAGSWIHSHNLAPLDSVVVVEPIGIKKKIKRELRGPRTFMGYSRAKGPAGIRNHVLVLPVVACANGVVRAAAKELVDVTPIEHAGGCGRGGRDNNRTIRVLEGIATHPNVAAVALVGLGCEVAQWQPIMKTISESGRPVKYFSIQAEGGSIKTTRKVVDTCREMIKEVKQQKREPQPITDLTIGLECGGSDALSGVTANPTVGLVSDWLVNKGGSVILSETTELIGAEHLMKARCKDKETSDKFTEIINKNHEIARIQLGEFAHLAISPGNQDGGLSSIMEKSLGCIAKCGTTPVVEVVPFGQKPVRQGLVIMDTPGYDVESISGKAAGGCQAILFTTGRGTPIGNSIAPTLKLSSNTNLWETFEDDLDINCGDIISKDQKMEEVAQSALDLLLETCNGKHCKSEQHNQTYFALSFTIEAL